MSNNKIIMNSNLISLGERIIQKTGRIAIADVMTRNGLKEGDIVNVFIQKVEK